MFCKKMRLFYNLLIFACIAAVSRGAPKPEIKDGEWNIPFMYWSELSPALEGTGNNTFLCEVSTLGEESTEPRQFRPGTLKLIEILNGDEERFSSFDRMSVKGCEGLKIGDRIILIVADERIPSGEDVLCIIRHRGTNCLIGHRLTRSDEEGYSKASEDALVALARRGFSDIAALTPDELRTLSIMDPDGVREVLIRQIETRIQTGSSRNELKSGSGSD